MAEVVSAADFKKYPPAVVGETDRRSWPVLRMGIIQMT